MATGGALNMDEEQRKTCFNARKAAKSAVTRKENEILDEMCSFEETNLQSVKSKMDELVESMERFRKKHSDFHSLLLDGAERQASEEYFEDVEEKYLHIMDKIKNYKQSVERKLASTEILLGESAGGAGSFRSSRSGRSRRSSVSSARVKAAAKKAVLQAEMAALDKQTQLEEEEMRLTILLKQKKEKLRLETEMAKAHAEETVLAEAEESSLAERLSQKLTVGDATFAEPDYRLPSEGATANVRPALQDTTASPSHPRQLLEGATLNPTYGDVLAPSSLPRQPPGGAPAQLQQSLEDVTLPPSHTRPSPGGATVMPPRTQALPFATAPGHTTIEGATVMPHVNHPSLGVTTPSLGGAAVDHHMHPSRDTTALHQQFSAPTGGVMGSSTTVPTIGTSQPIGGAAALSRDIPVEHTRSRLNPHAPDWTFRQNPLVPTASQPYSHGTSPHTHGSDDSLVHIIQQGQQQQRQLLNAVQIPKVELMTFDGDPLSYWGFIRMFDNCVEKDTVDSGSKLSCLLQYTSGKARSVIQCCAVMRPEQGYARARQLLEERFGNAFVITETWINKVTNGPVIKPHERHKLQEYADELRSCAETLQAMGNFAEISSQGSLVKIIGRLPFFMQNKWKSKVHHIRKLEQRNPNINDVTAFVLEAAEVANDPVYGGLTDNIAKPDYTRQPLRKSGSFNVYTTNAETQELCNAYGSNDYIPTCVKCNGAHSLFGCMAFKELKVQDRLNFAFDKKLCYNCLKPGHFSNTCRLTRTCSVPGCNAKHTKFLHPLDRGETSQDKSVPAPASKPEVLSSFSEVSDGQNYSATGASHRNVRVALPILPVIVRAPGSQRHVRTFALLDPGSTSTFCSEDLVKTLGVIGKKGPLSLTTLEKKNSETETLIVNLEVSNMSNETVLELPEVYARPHLPININNMGRSEDLNGWEHLRDVEIPKVDADKVTLLIGQDVPKALMPIDLRTGKPGDPYATKTALGWTLHGPLGGRTSSSGTAIANFVQVNHDLRNLNQQILEDEPKVKKAKVYHTETIDRSSGINQMFEQRSSWHSLKKDIAWLIRFKNWIMKNAKTGPLSVEETENAEIAMVRYIQKQHFGNEMATLDSSSKLKRSSKLFRLGPVMSSQGVLVTGRRLKNAPIPEHSVHQLILPRNHPVADLIIKDTHEKIGHCGREYVLSEVRQRYWIIGIRPTIRHVLNSCFGCRKRCAPLPCEQKMAYIPQSYVTPGDPPLTYVYARCHWRQVQYLANLFWSRWIKEYLTILQSRQKWLMPKRNLVVGDIVLVFG